MDKTILLVEDNPDDVKLTLRAFAKNNFNNHIDIARDGVEALDFLFARGDFADRAGRPMPTLVLLDLKLPRMDGLQVLKAMRADPRTRLTPVVILTTSGEQQDKVEGYSLGANSYVRKPVNFAEFTEAARTLGVYWLALNESPHPPPGG
jgi:two-component system response regulator